MRKKMNRDVEQIWKGNLVNTEVTCLYLPCVYILDPKGDGGEGKRLL